jgi:hypothetical protein
VTKLGELIRPDTADGLPTTTVILSAIKAALKGPGIVSWSTLERVLVCLPKAPHHEVYLNYGLQTVLRDVGQPLRINALETIVQAFSVDRSIIDIDELIEPIVGAFNDEALRRLALQFLGTISEYPEAAFDIPVRYPHTISPALVDLEEKLFQNAPEGDEIEIYLGLMARLRVLIDRGSVAYAAFQPLYAKHEDDERMGSLIASAEYTIKFNKTAGEQVVQAKSVAYQLMAQYNPEALAIFAN